MYRMLLSFLCALCVGGQAEEARLSRSLLIADFESSMAGWKLEARSGLESYRKVSMTWSNLSHAGEKSMQLHIQPDQGWMAVRWAVSQDLPNWVRCRPDELVFWLRGDGSPFSIYVGFRGWNKQLQPVDFLVPVSLQDRSWQEIVIPFSRLQSAQPQETLSLLAISDLVICSDNANAAMQLWVDDMRVRNGSDQGNQFTVDLFQKEITSRPAVSSMPRIGSWNQLRTDSLALARNNLTHMGFFSNSAPYLKQEYAYLHGLATNFVPGRLAVAPLRNALHLTPDDMDQDILGRNTVERVGDMYQSDETMVFHPAFADRFCEHIKTIVDFYSAKPWICSFMLPAPVSLYGEVHYAISKEAEFPVFSRPARENFRQWLKKAYNHDLREVSKSWGQSFTDWQEIIPPFGPVADASGIDKRKCWSDFMFWYNSWLEQISDQTLAAAREKTAKPIGLILGGPKIGIAQGVCSGNTGALVKILGHYSPAFLNDTDSQTLFAAKYSRAACALYGVQLMVEYTGPPYLAPALQYNTAINALASATDLFHCAPGQAMYDPSHWLYGLMPAVSDVIHNYHPVYQKNKVTFFHSYLTSWYRPDRSNSDVLRVYDTSNMLWFPASGYPSWGRALGCPDVVDDVMIEDGGLAGRKLLVIPNSSVTLTSRKAVHAIKQWVRQGGVLVGFGKECLGYTIEDDRSVSYTPGIAGMMPVAKLQESKGVAEHRLGKGSVILFPNPVDPAHSFAHEVVPSLVGIAEKAGIKRLCRTDDRDDANIIYCGVDAVTGKHIFVADFTRHVRYGMPGVIFWCNRDFSLSFDPSLKGAAELIAFTDSYYSCKGGQVDYDDRNYLLHVRFNLPGDLRLSFRDSRQPIDFDTYKDKTEFPSYLP